MTELHPDTLCNLCRVRVAECTLDGEPLCIVDGCADAVLERLVLVGEHPELARHLAPLEDAIRTGVPL